MQIQINITMLNVPIGVRNMRKFRATSTSALKHYWPYDSSQIHQWSLVSCHMTQCATLSSMSQGKRSTNTGWDGCRSLCTRAHSCTVQVRGGTTSVSLDRIFGASSVSETHVASAKNSIQQGRSGPTTDLDGARTGASTERTASVSSRIRGAFPLW